MSFARPDILFLFSLISVGIWAYPYSRRAEFCRRDRILNRWQAWSHSIAFFFFVGLAQPMLEPAMFGAMFSLSACLIALAAVSTLIVLFLLFGPGATKRVSPDAD